MSGRVGGSAEGRLRFETAAAAAKGKRGGGGGKSLGAVAAVVGVVGGGSEGSEKAPVAAENDLAQKSWVRSAISDRRGGWPKNIGECASMPAFK